MDRLQVGVARSLLRKSWLWNLILGFIAYRRLLWVGGWRGATKEVEDWFFVPAETSPLIVILIGVWLLYRRRERLRQLTCEGGPGWLVAGLFVAGSAFFLWGYYVRAYDLLAPSLMLNGLGCAVLYRGISGASAALLPIVTLAFAIPIPAPLLSQLVWRFQVWTAEYTGWIFLAFGDPVRVTGELIQRAGQTFEVIETCSGLRSLEILTLLAVLMADLFRRGRLHGVLLVLAAPFVAFAMNGFRVVTLILNPGSQALAVHNLQGVLVLIGGLLVLYAYDGLLERLLRFRRKQVSASDAGSKPVSAVARSGPARGNVLTAVVAGLVVASFWIVPWQGPRPVPVNTLRRQVPLEMGRWQGMDVKSDVNFRGKVMWSSELHRLYWSMDRHADRPEAVELFLGLSLHRLRLLTSFSPKNDYPGAGWAVEEEGRTRFESGGADVNWRVLSDGSRLLLVYSWYEGYRGLAREGLRSFFALDTSPFHRDRPALFCRMSSQLRELSDSERKRAGSELRLLHEEVRERLAIPSWN